MTHSQTQARSSALVRGAMCFLAIYLVMTSYYILKPVRDSFFIEYLGFRRLPQGHLLVMAVTYVTAVIYTKALRRIGYARVVPVALTLMLGCMLAFWVALHFGTSDNFRPKLALVYWCWVSVFSVFTVTVIWSLTHTLFSADEAAKSYGLIGSGATCGAMTGGGITSVLAEPIGTEQLLMVAAVVLAPCILLGHQLSRVSTASTEAAPPVAEVRKKSAWKLFARSPYLCGLFALLFVWVFTMVLDEYRHWAVIGDAFKDETDKRTAFLGSIALYSNMIGLVLSTLVTWLVLTRLGALPGLLAFATLIVASGVGFLLEPSLALVAGTRVAYGAVGYSIGQWSREFLYSVRTKEEKFIAKGFIDTVGFRFGGGFAALALLAAAQIGSDPDGLLGNAVRDLSFATIPLGFLLAALACWLCFDFRRQRRSASP